MVRITEGLGVLALAADAATGRPRGSGLSAAIVAAEFSRRIGEDLATQKDAYFLALVRFIGCTITSHETGMLSFGDDQGFAVATMLGDWADREDLKKHLNHFIAHEATKDERDAAFNYICDILPDAAPDFTAAHCRQSYLLASRLPVSQTVLTSAARSFYGQTDRPDIRRMLSKGLAHPDGVSKFSKRCEHRQSPNQRLRLRLAAYRRSRSALRSASCAAFCAISRSAVSARSASNPASRSAACAATRSAASACCRSRSSFSRSSFIALTFRSASRAAAAACLSARFASFLGSSAAALNRSSRCCLASDAALRRPSKPSRLEFFI